MVAEVLTPFLKDRYRKRSGVIVTSVFPGGCQLDCPFCIVRQREERSIHSHMTPEHYSAFLSALGQYCSLGGAAIAGDEPLQFSAWPYTQAFAEAARELDIPLALITNGLELAEYAPKLNEIRPQNIYISLDAVGEQHDRIRRKPGAFAKISDGLSQSMEYPRLRRALNIATILLPGNRDTLENLLAYAAQNGVRRVVLSPLVVSRRTAPAQLHRRSFEQAVENLPYLVQSSHRLGVHLTLSDEFALLGEWDAKIAESGITLVRPDGPVAFVRIDAFGTLETYEQIRLGTTTGLRLPGNLEAMHLVAHQVARHLARPIHDDRREGLADVA